MSDGSRNQTNDLTASLVKSVGGELAKSGLGFEQQMICLEGLATALIAFYAIRHNKHPDELVEAFSAGVRERLTQVIYGAKQ